MNKNIVRIVLAMVLGVFAFVAPSHAAMFATIDLTPVTDQVTSLSTAVVTASALVIGAALAFAAVVFGGKRLWGLFKSMSR